MIVKFFDRQDEKNPRNGTIIKSREELLIIIDEVKGNKPFFFELVGENGNNLLIGISYDIGCIQHSASDGSPPYLMTLGYPDNTDHEYVEFLIADTPTPVRKRYCIPFEKLIKIAAHFVECGERSDITAWEEI